MHPYRFRALGAMIFLGLASLPIEPASSSEVLKPTPPAAPSPSPVKPIRLQPLAIDPAAVTVSGISSGAFMAVQLQVARSSLFGGVATVAGGPFYCAQGKATVAQTECMGNPDAIKVPELAATTREMAARRHIDPLDRLQARGNIFIIQGTVDTVVKPAAASKLEAYFREFIPEEKIQLKTDLPAGHGFPTLDYGLSCENEGKPWLNRCKWDGAGAILATLSGGETPLNPRGSAESSSLQPFDQTEFAPASASMGKSGWIYIPKDCQNAESGKPQCKLHVALHGCAQSPEFTQDLFPINAGYNEWAETNRIVVLYPAATTGKQNPMGCWDWWGYTGTQYATRDGAQIKAISSMVQRLIGTDSGGGAAARRKP